MENVIADVARITSLSLWKIARLAITSSLTSTLSGVSLLQKWRRKTIRVISESVRTKNEKWVERVQQVEQIGS